MAKTPEEMTNKELLYDFGRRIWSRDEHEIREREILKRMAPTPPAPMAAQTPNYAQAEKCGSVFKLKDGYICSEPKGHYPATPHECECPNPAFTQRWTDEHAEKAEQVDAARCPACGGKVQFDDFFQPMCTGACGGKWHIEHMEVSDFAQFFRAASLNQETQPPSNLPIKEGIYIDVDD